MSARDIATIRRALALSLQVLHPTGPFLRRQPERSRAERSLENVRRDIRDALKALDRLEAPDTPDTNEMAAAGNEPAAAEDVT